MSSSSEGIVNAKEPSVTDLISRWKGGDSAALHELTPLIYDDLVRAAKARLDRESYARTLEPSALVHEAFFRLSKRTTLVAQNRAHFYAIAAITMKRVLIEHARKRMAQKREAGERVTLHPEIVAQEGPRLDLLDLHEALERFSMLDPRKARIIEQKYFGGMTNEELALVEGISVATVGRELRLGQAWLRLELGGKNAET